MVYRTFKEKYKYSKNAIVSAACIYFLVLLSLFLPLFSWDWVTHEFINENVYLSLPLSYREKIDKESFMRGSTAPDKKEYRYIFKWSHVYHPATNVGSGIDAVASLVDEAVELFKFNKKKQASFLLGAALHYASDLMMPLHTDQKYWETNELHNQIEKSVDDLLTSHQFIVDYEPIDSLQIYILKNVRNANTHYETLYYEGSRPDILKKQVSVSLKVCASVVRYCLEKAFGASLKSDVVSSEQTIQTAQTSQMSQTGSQEVIVSTTVNILPHFQTSQAVSPGVVTSVPLLSSVLSEGQTVFRIDIPPRKEEKGIHESIQESTSKISSTSQSSRLSQSSQDKTAVGQRIKVPQYKGFYLEPGKSYLIQVIPDGSGGMYLDITEVK